MTGYGWATIPGPSVLRAGDSMLWAGGALLDWGGSPLDSSGCSADGNEYTPRNGWTPMPAAPKGLCNSHAIWTGKEATFFTGGTGKHSGGVAFDPAAGTWRTLPPAPADIPGAVVVWTGKEMIAWGGGDRGEPSTYHGAAYDPVANKWRVIKDSPIGLNAAQGVWTGKYMIVFGSSLDGGHHASTKNSVGAAYDPTSDTWRVLPPSALSPQATSVAWDGNGMVAWDYANNSQVFSPNSWSWGPVVKMPMRPDECYPQSSVVGHQVFAWFCGQAALYDSGKWTRVSGGATDVKVEAYGRRINMFRFGQFAASSDALFMQATGITVSAKGTACYGCRGAPVSYWIYRPGPAGAQCLNTGGRDMYEPLISPSSGPGGSSFTVFGNVPTTSESGRYLGPSGSIEFWWNLDPENWVSAVGVSPTPSPASPSPVVNLGSAQVEGHCTYGVTFQVPAATAAGTYRVVGIESSGRSSASLAPVSFAVVPSGPG